MKERERIVVSGLVLLMLMTWLGFVFHQSPRFAGSFWGGVLAVSGSVLMLVPLAYMFVKRIPGVKSFVTSRVRMKTLLTWHIYAGVLGPILVILHTGHKFESPLGIALTGMTLIVVISGFVGRYLMTFFSREIREKRKTLTDLQAEYQKVRLDLEDSNIQELSAFSFLRARLVARLSEEPPPGLAQLLNLARLAESIADVEYAIATHEHFKSAFKAWLKLHIVLSLVLYILLGLHVWASIHFGLRWFS
jgi:hypothetical protein